MLDMKQLMGEMPKPAETQKTATGRIYTTIAKAVGTEIELKFNFSVGNGALKDGEQLVNIKVIALRFAQLTGLGCPNFELAERESQVEEQAADGLYRYLPVVFPLCVNGPPVFIKTRWVDQDVTAKLREFIKLMVKKAGGDIILSDDQFDPLIDGWMQEVPSIDPNYFSDVMDPILKKFEHDEH